MPSLRIVLGLLSLYVVLYAAGWGPLSLQQQTLAGSKRPNIVMVLTDDQDLHMDSLAYMPHVQKFIAEQGTCPSIISAPMHCAALLTSLFGLANFLTTPM